MKLSLKLLVLLLCVIVLPFNNVNAQAIDNIHYVNADDMYYSNTNTDMNLFDFSSRLRNQAALLNSSRAINTVLIKTPNGSNVMVYQVNSNLSNNEILEKDQEIQIWYPEAQRISSANPNYNCHSYAWYNQSDNNPYWMDDPSMYYYDKSYEEVQLEDGPRPGDIMCYFNYYGVNIHSSIVTDFCLEDELDELGFPQFSVTVKSKWGSYGVYSHLSEECPYTIYAHHYDLLSLSEKKESIATLVKFYRPRVESHYDLSQNMDCVSVNKDIVSDNGVENIEDTYSMYELNVLEEGYYTFTITTNNLWHSILYDIHMQNFYATSSSNYEYTYEFTLNLLPGYYYLRTEYLDAVSSGNIIVQMETHQNHQYKYVKIDSTYHEKKCIYCGYILIEQEFHIWTGYLANQVKCEHCGYLKVLDIGEFIPIIKNKIPVLEDVYMK